MESPTSSAFSVISGSSEVSYLDRIGSHADDPSLDSHNSTKNASPNSDTVSTVPEYGGEPMFEPGDGDIKIEVGGTSFETHKYLLKRFDLLKHKLNETRSGTPLRIHGTDTVEDFRNTLKVLYATVLEGPFEFESTILISALRIATRYEYPALRVYAISHLELAQLTAIERIKIAREFGLTSWEEPAYVELCERDEPITREEANILGMDMFVRVAEIREQEQRRRGKEVDARRDGLDADGGDCPTAAQPSECLPQANIGQGAVSQPSGVEPSSDEDPDPTGDKRNAMESATAQCEKEFKLSPSFVDIPTDLYPSEQLRWVAKQRLVKVPGCECKLGGPTSCELVSPWGCLVTPCAVAAIKNIQIQQIEHAKSIADLKSFTSKFIASPLPDVAPVLIHPKPVKSSVHKAVQIMLSTT